MTTILENRFSLPVCLESTQNIIINQFPKEMICNEVYICHTDMDKKFAVYGLCKIELTKNNGFSGNYGSALNWLPVYFCESIEDGKMWCDTKKLSIKSPKTLFRKYKSLINSYKKSAKVQFWFSRHNIENMYIPHKRKQQNGTQTIQSSL